MMKEFFPLDVGIISKKETVPLNTKLILKRKCLEHAYMPITQILLLYGVILGNSNCHFNQWTIKTINSSAEFNDFFQVKSIH